MPSYDQLNRIQQALTPNYRTDLLGAIDQFIAPLLPFDYSMRPSLYNDFHPSTHHNASTTEPDSSPIHELPPMLQAVALEMHDLATLIEDTLTKNKQMDPLAFVWACFSIHYQLLTRPSLSEVDDALLYPHDASLDEAFRLGALIFMKEMLREFAFAVTGAKILVKKLRVCLTPILSAGTASNVIVLWLLFVSGMSAREEGDKKWFTTHLASIGRELNVVTFGDVKVVLQKVAWIGRILDGQARGLWAEVEGVMGVMGLVASFG